MPQRDHFDSKLLALRKHGALHPRPEQVNDPLFDDSEFFDPKDLVQVKYEMLRKVRVDGLAVTQASELFGFSRPSFYAAQQAFERHGLVGLISGKRGPRSAHKLTEQVMDFLAEVRTAEPSLNASALAERLEQRFGVSVHPRSIERALARREKKRR